MHSDRYNFNSESFKQQSGCCELNFSISPGPTLMPSDMLLLCSWLIINVVMPQKLSLMEIMKKRWRNSLLGIFFFIFTVNINGGDMKQLLNPTDQYFWRAVPKKEVIKDRRSQIQRRVRLKCPHSRSSMKRGH